MEGRKPKLSFFGKLFTDDSMPSIITKAGVALSTADFQLRFIFCDRASTSTT